MEEFLNPIHRSPENDPAVVGWMQECTIGVSFLIPQIQTHSQKVNVPSSAGPGPPCSSKPRLWVLTCLVFE